jgi:hypothetical protein
MKKSKFVNEDQELLKTILGTNKFLMLNLNLVKKLSPNGAVMLTYILDRAIWFLDKKEINSLDEGFFIYRRHFRDLGISVYQQTMLESKFKELGLLEVNLIHAQGDTWNEYKINLTSIAEYIEEPTPPKYLHPSP